MVAFAELPSPPATRFGPVRLVAETGSTNADLLERASGGEPAGSVLVTDHQRAGRGRQRRVWHDEPGNSLLVSVLLRPRPTHAPLLPLVTGLAAVDTVAAVLAASGDTGRVAPVGLKWPNDVLVPSAGERKLAGILAEASSTGGRIGLGGSTGSTSTRGADPPDLVVVVGMGMNLRWTTPPPADIEARVVTLTDLVGGPVDRDEILARFLTSLEGWLGSLETGGPIIERYRASCLTIGRDVRFASAGGEVRGRATDVTERGTLLLLTDSGDVVELSAGDAHHL